MGIYSHKTFKIVVLYIMDKDDTFISTIYYDPEKGLMGVDKLYKKLKKLNKKITFKQVKEWLKKQATYQIHYSKHKKNFFLINFLFSTSIRCKRYKKP